MRPPSRLAALARPSSFWDSYATLLALLTGALVLFPFVGDSLIAAIGSVGLTVAAIIVSYRASDASAIVIARVTVGAVILGSTLTAILVASGDVISGIANLGLAVLIGSGPIVILRHVFTAPKVTMPHVIGALSAYIEIGFFFTFVFRAVDKLTEQAFFAQTSDPSAFDFLYFSFITMTTVGYGDFSPALPLGRSLVILEVLIGSIFLVVLVARLVATLGTQREVPAGIDREEDGAGSPPTSGP
jgi:uncharacterized membrane protein